MGNTTIIELNHDFAYEIEGQPLRFAQEVIDQLRDMGKNGKKIMGGKVIAGFHRSGKGIYKDWEKFKIKHEHKL